MRAYQAAELPLPDLIDELWLRIFVATTPDALFKMLLVDKRMSMLVRDNKLWEIKFKQHFPYLTVTSEQADAEINYFFTFASIYINEYSSLSSNEIIIMNRLKEMGKWTDDLINLIEGQITLTMLKLLRTWAQAKDDQNALDLVYQCTLRSINIYITEEFTIGNRFHWIAEYHQPVEEIGKFRNFISQTCVRGNRSKLERKLLNMQDADGNTPLLLAVKGRQLDAVKILLTMNPDINIGNKVGQKPVHFASFYGDTAILKAILPHHPDLESPMGEFTPLFIAAERGHDDVIDALLAEEVAVDATCKNQLTPLHTASMNGHLNIVRALLAKGANANAVNSLGQPLHSAAHFGYFEIAELLIKNHAEINAVNNKNQTPLYLASLRGHHKVVRLLLARGATVTDEGILHVACSNGHRKVVEILLAHRADVEAIYKGWKPLHFAIQHGHDEIAKLLLAHNADVNATRDNWTPLLFAVHLNNVDMVNVLLDHNASANSVYPNGISVLHYAAHTGNLLIVLALLEKGADINAITSSGESSLYLAVKYGHGKVAELLIAQGAKLDVELVKLAEETNNADLVERIKCAQKNQYSATTSTEFNSLHRAAKQGNLFVVMKLLEDNNNNINAPDETGMTPLLLAVQAGHIPIVELFLEGADLAPRQVTKSALNELIKDCDKTVKDRLEKFSTEQSQAKGWRLNLWSTPSKEIMITPIEMAEIMEHTDIVERLHFAKRERNSNKVSF